jgi:serine-type D-Ala-D-Ala carboxypeptidase/endopeptidase (penicillin-binding protein 4)
MLKIWSLGFLIAFSFAGTAQNIGQKLETSWSSFVADNQLQYGIAGICVMDAKTGKIVFEKNSNIGFAPASTQKVLTTIAAYEALGSGFTYETKIGYTGSISNKKLTGNIVIEASGDPTLGSWRYAETKEDVVLKRITGAVKQAGIETITGDLVATNKGFDINPIPDNWMWGNMGNYYGAGHWGLNWRENQYDLFLNSGPRMGDSTFLVGFEPDLRDENETIYNEVKTGNANTGDGSSIYTAPFSFVKMIQGKITSNQKLFKVSGSMSFADIDCMDVIAASLQKNGLSIKGGLVGPSAKIFNSEKTPDNPTMAILVHNSPSLDSIVYWFLKKSVNLYGEALVRTIGLQKKGYGSTDKGLEWIDSFYSANGFDTKAMHMTDGSGLSPTNRITPFALVKALQFAQNKSWFPAFYDALPLYNGMKLKSGTIHRTKAFAGYHNGYIVSIMVNNYNGSSGNLVDKMYKVLDGLK